jgi:peroxiredoxin
MAKPPPRTESTQSPLATVAYGLFVLAAAAAVYGFVTVAKEGELRRRCNPTCILHPQYAAADRKVPDFTLTDAKGVKVDIASYRGKTVVLNFWTRTCGPCLEEMPQIAELTHILANRPDVAVVTVSTDEGPDAVKDVLRSVLKEYPPPFTVLFDPDGDQVVDAKFGTHLFPETWIIDPRGVVRARFDGSREWATPEVVEYIEQIREGGYCPVEIDGDRTTGEGAHVCTSGV